MQNLSSSKGKQKYWKWTQKNCRKTLPLWPFSDFVVNTDWFGFTVCFYLTYRRWKTNIWIDMIVFHDVIMLKCIQKLEFLKTSHRYHRISEAMILCHGTIKLQGPWPLSICSIKLGLFALNQKNQAVNSYEGCHLPQPHKGGGGGLQSKTSEVTLFGPKQSVRKEDMCECSL